MLDTVPGSSDWVQLDPDERRRLALRACETGNIAALVSLIRAHLSLTTTVSHHTLRAYRRGISLLLQHWSGEELIKPGEHAIQQLMSALQSSGASPSSIKVWVTGMRALYAALRWAGVTSADPFADVHLRASPESKRSQYTLEEYRLLLNAAEPSDRALIQLVGELGLPIEEAAVVRWDDVDLSSGEIRVRHSGHQRTMKLGANVRDSLAALPQRNEFLLGYGTATRARQRLSSLCERTGIVYRGAAALRSPDRSLTHTSPPREHQTRTTLPGLVQFRQEIARVQAQAARTGVPYGLLTLTIDGIDATAAKYGAGIANHAAHIVGARLTRLLRAYDFVAELGRGKFAVILQDLPSEQKLIDLAERVRNRINGSVTLRGKRIPIPVTVETTWETVHTPWLRDETVQPSRMEDTLQLVPTCLNAFNAGDRSAFESLLSPDIELEEPTTDRVKRGSAAAARHAFAWHALVPDVRGVITEVVSSGHEALLQLQWSGTFEGRSRTVRGYVVIGTEGGKIRRLSYYVDRTAELTELGLLSADGEEEDSEDGQAMGREALP